MFCKHCGKQLVDGSAFCEFCGKRQEPQPTQAPPQRPVSQPNTPPISAAPAKRVSGPNYGILTLCVAIALLAGSVMFGLSRLNSAGGNGGERETAPESSVRDVSAAREEERQESDNGGERETSSESSVRDVSAAREEERQESGNAAGGIIGTWILAEATIEGQTLSPEELASETGETAEIMIEFMDNGELLWEGEGLGLRSGEGTYEFDGYLAEMRLNKYTLFLDLALSGDRLTTEYNGMGMVFFREGTDGEPGDASEIMANSKVVGAWFDEDAVSTSIFEEKDLFRFIVFTADGYYYACNESPEEFLASGRTLEDFQKAILSHKYRLNGEDIEFTSELLQKDDDDYPNYEFDMLYQFEGDELALYTVTDVRAYIPYTGELPELVPGYME